MLFPSFIVLPSGNHHYFTIVDVQIPLLAHFHQFLCCIYIIYIVYIYHEIYHSQCFFVLQRADFSMICRCSSEIRVINFLITCWLGNYGKLIKRSHVLCFFDVLGHVLWLFDDFWPFSVSLLVLNVGNGWESGNGMIITSDEMDHSRKFPA